MVQMPRRQAGQRHRRPILFARFLGVAVLFYPMVTPRSRLRMASRRVTHSASPLQTST